jgi:hypothetical protein
MILEMSAAFVNTYVDCGAGEVGVRGKTRVAGLHCRRRRSVSAPFNTRVDRSGDLWFDSVDAGCIRDLFLRMHG